MTVPVEIPYFERPFEVEAMVDTYGISFPRGMSIEDKREIFNQCEIHLFSKLTGKRLKKLESMLTIDQLIEIRSQIIESGVYS